VSFKVSDGRPASFARAARALFGFDDFRIVGEVTFSPDHAEVLVREQSSHATLRSRVARTPDPLDRLVELGAEDLVVIVAPFAAATLALADPQPDSARMERILASLSRWPAHANDRRAQLLRAAYDAANGRCRAALPVLQRILSERPQAVWSQLVAAGCHAELGDRDKTLERLALASEHATDPLGLTRAGLAHVRIGQPLRGLERLRVAHAQAPHSPLNAIAIGEALVAAHRPAEALGWLRAHRAEGAWRERWLAARGIAEVRSGEGPAAAATAALLRAEYPASLAALRIEAELAYATKAWAQALGRFGALRLMVPGDGLAHAGEGATLVALRRPADAIASYRACSEASPWLAECRLGLGIALREADRTEEALKVLQEAQQLDQLDPRIPTEIARTLRALLRRDEAAVFTARADAAAQKLDQKLVLP
jgi:tetratricopeptide (TPR) repeat protein